MLQWMGGLINEWMVGSMDRSKDRSMDGRMDGCTNGWMDPFKG